MTLAILQSYTQNSGDAWTYTLDAIGRYFERILNDKASLEKLGKPTPEIAREMIGSYIDDSSRRISWRNRSTK